MVVCEFDEKLLMYELRRLEVDFGMFWLVLKRLKLICFENGTLWLKDKLYIGTSNNGTYQAGLGFLPLVTNSLQQITTQVKKKTMEGSNPRYDTIQLNLSSKMEK